jgi:hypothetical protein
VDADMTLHDAAMTQFGQWWKRSKRSGHAYAEIASIYGAESPGSVRSTRSIVLFGALLPLVALALAEFTFGLSLLLFAVYPVQFAKVYRYMRDRGLDTRTARAYAFFVVLSKFPGFLGVVQYHLNRLRGRAGTLIEYK